MFIGVSGPIGVGKSTLTRTLAETLGYQPYFEPVETNPYLDDFYKDMARWGFTMQMFLLAKRFAQHQELVWRSDWEGVVQDRTIYEDTVFAKLLFDAGHIDRRDYDTYLSHFHVMMRYLVYPDLLVYLRCVPQVAMERIKSRGRDAEKGISMDYLQKLHAGYEDFATQMADHTTVLWIDWAYFKTADEVAELVKKNLRVNPFSRSLRKI